MKNSELQLNIISAEKKVFSGSVTSVVAPGVSGLFGVFANHAPMITALKAGEIVYTMGNKEEKLEINGGIVEVNNNSITICIS